MRDIGNTYLRESVLAHTPLHDRKRTRPAPETSTPKVPSRALSHSALACYSPYFASSQSPAHSTPQVSPQIKRNDTQEPIEH